MSRPRPPCLHCLHKGYCNICCPAPQRNYTKDERRFRSSCLTWNSLRDCLSAFHANRRGVDNGHLRASETGMKTIIISLAAATAMLAQTTQTTQTQTAQATTMTDGGRKVTVDKSTTTKNTVSDPTGTTSTSSASNRSTQVKRKHGKVVKTTQQSATRSTDTNP